MRIRLLNKNSIKPEAGDTIVEVLIALVIVGAVLTGAYTTSTRSLDQVRRSEERAVATKIAETHLETIKSIVNSGDTALLDQIYTPSGNGFCLEATDSSAPVVREQDISPFPELADAELSVGPPAGVYQSDCVHNDFFHVHVLAQTDERFTATVRWERFGGGGLDELQIIYGIRRGSN